MPMTKQTWDAQQTRYRIGEIDLHQIVADWFAIATGREVSAGDVEILVEKGTLEATGAQVVFHDVAETSLQTRHISTKNFEDLGDQRHDTKGSET